MTGFDILAYLFSVVMITMGLGVEIHAQKSTRGADRRDPDSVKRVIDELSERP